MERCPKDSAYHQQVHEDSKYMFITEKTLKLTKAWFLFLFFHIQIKLPKAISIIGVYNNQPLR